MEAILGQGFEFVPTVLQFYFSVSAANTCIYVRMRPLEPSIPALQTEDGAQ